MAICRILVVIAAASLLGACGAEVAGAADTTAALQASAARQALAQQRDMQTKLDDTLAKAAATTASAADQWSHRLAPGGRSRPGVADKPSASRQALWAMDAKLPAPTLLPPEPRDLAFSVIFCKVFQGHTARVLSLLM
jgi:hypothetical protein